MGEEFEARANPEENLLIQQIFGRARELVESFGKDVDPEIFGKQMPAKFVMLDVPDKKEESGDLILYKFQPDWLRFADFTESTYLVESSGVKGNIFYQIIPEC